MPRFLWPLAPPVAHLVTRGDFRAAVKMADFMTDLSKLDSQIADLVRQRLGVAAGDPDPAGASDEKHVGEVLNHIQSLAQTRQRRQPVAAYLGPKYSYSYLAAAQFFGEGASMLPVATIGAVFEAVVAGDTERGIVPIENSTDGRVVDTISRLIAGQDATSEKNRDATSLDGPGPQCLIVGEVRLPIHHCLLSMTDRDQITEIQSKPQALSQCRGYLNRHFPTAKQTSVASTAAAASAAATTSGVAAIASAQAGRHLRLKVVAEDIEDNPDNVTRFVVLGTQPAPRSGDDKTSLMLQVKHQPGSLADAMMVFKQHQLNLTFIESFPIPGEADEYFFIVELQGHRDDEPVREALAALDDATHRTLVLGSYPRG